MVSLLFDWIPGELIRSDMHSWTEHALLLVTSRLCFSGNSLSMPPAYFQSASWGSDSKSADTAKLTLFTHKANEATANRYSRIFDLISCTVLIPKASDPGLSPKIAIPMSCQSNPPASRGDDLRKKHIPTGGDIWSDIWVRLLVKI